MWKLTLAFVQYFLLKMINFQKKKMNKQNNFHGLIIEVEKNHTVQSEYQRLH